VIRCQTVPDDVEDPVSDSETTERPYCSCCQRSV